MRGTLAAVLGLLCGSAVHAEAPRDLSTAIALARVAEERGAAALRVQLAAKEQNGEALLAIRASIHAEPAESLLTPLAALACGRHPVLAPEAAYAILRITERLRASELDAQETLLSDLRAARAALACTGAPTPRADIVSLLERSAALLDALSP